jgi:hypothetical protein
MFSSVAECRVSEGIVKSNTCGYYRSGKGTQRFRSRKLVIRLCFYKLLERRITFR